MSMKNQLSKNIQEIWAQLSTSWTGDDAKVFHDGYILKMIEIADSFDKASSDLGNISSELMKELKSIEYSITNR